MSVSPIGCRQESTLTYRMPTGVGPAVFPRGRAAGETRLASAGERPSSPVVPDALLLEDAGDQHDVLGLILEVHSITTVQLRFVECLIGEL